MQFAEKTLAQHLQAMIRCRTVSHERGTETDWQEFAKLHELLQNYYPVIYREFTLTETGEAGLQFSYQADQPKKKPLLLMAHQDVVETGDEAKWTHAPFAGEIQDGMLWGRGATDCKHLLLAELEAVEKLFAAGWRPDYDLYLSFGFGEEIYRADGPDGAELLCAVLQKKGVRLGCIIDEGGYVQKHQKTRVARIGLGEKACVNFEIYKTCAGGHSSKPGKGTALGAVAKAAAVIEEHPYPYRLTPLVKAQLQASAVIETGDRKRVFAEPEKYWQELCEYARQDKELDAMLHTTIAVTMASASNQPNVLPSYASMTLSCRILQGDTVDSVMTYLKQFLPEGVEIRHISGKDPVKTATPDSNEFKTIAGVLRQQYGENLVVVPFLMLGATDTRYYAPIADNVFLFDGFVRDERWGEAHQLDERIPVDTLAGACDFFVKFLTSY